ncbi:MAG TPA: hypothetical protein VMT68_05015 [Caulobacteraceae bacterium]|nr:hypothetical protein [Caulobacteraceae bacterium]
MKFFGFALIALGVLMVLLCGGCTLTLLAVSVWQTLSSSEPTTATEIISGLMLFGLVGGLPTAAGAVLAWAGWRMVRARPGAGQAS